MVQSEGCVLPLVFSVLRHAHVAKEEETVIKPEKGQDGAKSDEMTWTAGQDGDALVLGSRNAKVQAK